MTANSTPANPTRFFRGPMIDANRRALDFQKRVFDGAFEMATSIQERQEEVLGQWVENSERLPVEAKSLVQEWTTLFENGRKSFREAVDASFGLANSYLDSLTPPATDEA